MDDLVARKFLRFLESALVVLFAASLPISLTASWVVLNVGLVVSILAWLLDKFRPPATSGSSASSVPSGEKPWGAPLAIPVFIFWLVVTVSGGINSAGDVDLVSQALKSSLSLKALVVYFWARHVFTRDPRMLFSSLQPMLITAAVGGVWGTIQQVFNYHPFGYQYLQGTGFHGGPMPFAGQMQMFSMLALALLFCRGYAVFAQGIVVAGRKICPGILQHTPVMVALTVACCSGLLFAGERSAWIGGVVGALSLAGLLGWRYLASAIAALGVLGAGAWIFVPLVRVRIESLFNSQQDISVQARLILWERARHLWEKSPWFGVGIQKFPPLAMPEAIVPGRSFVLDHAHSNYWHILATTGALGFAAFVGMWLTALVVGVRSATATESPHWRAVYLGVTAGTVALLVSGAFEYNFGTAQVRLAQWFLLSMIGLSAYEQRAEVFDGALDSASDKTISV